MFYPTFQATHSINPTSHTLFMSLPLHSKEMLTLSEVQALADRCVITALLDRVRY